MSYRPVVGDILEQRVVCFDPNSPVQVGINVTHWQVTSFVGGLTTQQTIAATLDGLLAPLYKVLLNSLVTYRGVSCSKIWPLPVQSPEVSVANTGAGAGAGTLVPTQVRGIVKLFTDLGGRPFRGRVYIPFLDTSFISLAGNLAAGGVTALTNIANVLAAPYTASAGAANTTVSPVIYHRRGYGKPPANVHGVDVITRGIGSPLLGTQRRSGNYGRVNASSPF